MISRRRRPGRWVVGYYQDKQEAKLRQQMAGTGVEVVRKGDNITLDMPSSMTFAFDSSDLNAQFYPVLDKVAATLKKSTRRSSRWPGTLTASVATRTTSSCQRVGEQRRGLSASHGVKQARIVTFGAGEAHPVATNDTEDGRAQNRRMEITMVPVTEDSAQKAKQALVRVEGESDGEQSQRVRE